MSSNFKILSKESLASNIKKMTISARDIALNSKPGQFVVVRVNENGERIPLTIADTDSKAGIITIIFQEIGRTTIDLGELNVGDFILDVLGPLGNPTHIEKFENGAVVLISGGVGTAEIVPVAKAFRAAGNKVIGIIGARDKELLILENEMRQFCDEFIITTDNGSAGQKGLVSDVLNSLIARNIKIALVYAIGPVPMMRAISQITALAKIKTVVSLNPIMVDGTGMCGACRVSIDGKIKFACIEGPEFDAHKINWIEFSSRLNLYKDKEVLIKGCSCNDKDKDKNAKTS